MEPTDLPPAPSPQTPAATPPVLSPTPPYAPAPAETRSAWARRSVTLKLVAIAALTLVLLVPLLLLRGLIDERENLRDTARREVASSWGAPQAIEGPVLSVPVERPARDDKGAAIPNAAPLVTWVHFLPDSLSVEGTLTPEIRTRGIFDVVLYGSTATVKAQFPAPSFVGLVGVSGTPRLDQAVVQMGIHDLKGVKDAVRFQWSPLGAARTGSPADSSLEAASGLPTTDLFATGVNASVPLTEKATGYAFETTLALNGSTRFDVQPLGKETHVHLRSPWATPSFGGAFLPDTRTVAASGFEARWKVLSLNRDFPQRIVGRQNLSVSTTGSSDAEMAYDGQGNVPSVTESGFGVELQLPIDAYQKSMRTAEYGLLFVLLTFATFFFVEVLGGRRIHPVQYLLVGFAVSLFYLMLLAFAEYLPFNAAYGVAAAMVLTLVLLYTKAIFGEWRLAGTVTGLLAVFYLYFFVLLQLEEWALLVGSLGLFFVLAGLMYLSRRVDWYGMTTAADTPA